MTVTATIRITPMTGLTALSSSSSVCDRIDRSCDAHLYIVLYYSFDDSVRCKFLLFSLYKEADSTFVTSGETGGDRASIGAGGE
jgi:hypothetical protein